MYRTINDSLWSEPWLERLSKDARLLMVYLLTSPRQTPCGVVEIGTVTLACQTGLDHAEVEAAFGQLEAAGKIIRWADRDTVLVRRFFAWQRSNSSANYTIAAKRQLTKLPPAVQVAVVKEHPELGEGWVAPGDMGHTPTEPISMPSPTHGDKETTTGTATTPEATERDNGRVPAPPRAIRDPLKRREPEEIATWESKAFGKLWTYWGKVGDVGDAAKAWDALKPNRDLMQAMKNAIDRQRDAFRWGEPGGQAQPHLATWIRKERWHMEAVPNKVEAS